MQHTTSPPAPYIYGDMKLPNYFFSKHENHGLIISSEKPFIIGRVWTFKNAELLSEWTFDKLPETYIQVPGFNILIQYSGNMDGISINNVEDHLHKMMLHFLNDKISENYGYYKRFEKKYD